MHLQQLQLIQLKIHFIQVRQLERMCVPAVGDMCASQSWHN